MIDELFGNIEKEELKQLWPGYIYDEGRISKLVSTNIRHANIALNSILDIEERQFLENLFFDPTGWYRQINGNGMTRLKLAAMSLGLTNNIFTFDPESERKMLEMVVSYTKEEQLLAIRCYMKQKAVTYLTLEKYLKNIKKQDDMTIELYRGIRGTYDGQNYSHTGLECWTTSIDIANKFTRGQGYIVKKTYPITQIFAGNRSTFKNRPHNIYRNNGFYVRREHEMIVENIAEQYDCKNNIYIGVDGDIC